MEQTDCPVCVSSFNNSIKKKITCFKCNFSACKECIKRYLMESIEEPHCMNCKIRWFDKFCNINLTKSFMFGAYREHKKKQYIELEMSRFPQIQRDMQIKKHRKMYNRLNRLKNIHIIHSMSLIGNEKYFEPAEKIVFIDYLKNIEHSIDDKLKDINPLELVNPENEERKKFIKRCSRSDCNGFLSSRWKCGICNTQHCPECHEILEENHVCNQEILNNVALLEKESKNCPKCGVPISKISGCDQMWCTSCNTAFNWTTGRIINSQIHNPHYFEWLHRNTEGNIDLRNRQDYACNDYVDQYQIRAITNNEKIRDFYGTMNNGIGNGNHDNKIRKLDRHFLKNKINKTQFERQLITYKITDILTNEINECIGTFRRITNDILGMEDKKNIIESIKQAWKFTFESIENECIAKNRKVPRLITKVNNMTKDF